MMSSKNRMVTLALAALMAAGAARSNADPGADDWIELPVIVNLYKGCSVTEDEAKGYIERANEVLKQAKIKLKISKTNSDFEVGNNDANQAESEDEEALKKGKKELTDNTEGKGIKINFCDSPIDGRDGVNGWSMHTVPVVFVRENPDTEKQKEKSGNTVAHEICHALTLDYDLTDADDKDRLMYGDDSRTGTDLTDEEIEEIRREAAKRGIVETKPAGPPPSTPKQKETALGFNSSPASPPNAHGITDASVTALSGDPVHEVRLVLGGQTIFMPPGQYFLVFDTDANPGTGVNFGDVPGAERLLQVLTQPGVPFAMVQAADLIDNSQSFTTQAMVTTEHKFVETAAGTPFGSTPFTSVIEFAIPSPWFGFGAAPVLPVSVLSIPFPPFPVDGFTMPLDLLSGMRPPFVTTSDGQIDAAAGEAFMLSGAAFTPGAQLEATLDDDLLGFITADPAGNFSVAMTLAPATPTDTYFLTVFDPASGDFDFAVIEVLGGASCQADLSGSADPNDPAYGVPDGLVDASDFFYFLDQFAAGNLAVADLSGSADPNDPAYGIPDGQIDAADFFYYLDIFVLGCP